MYILWCLRSQILRGTGYGLKEAAYLISQVGDDNSSALAQQETLYATRRQVFQLCQLLYWCSLFYAAMHWQSSLNDLFLQSGVVCLQGLCMTC